MNKETLGKLQKYAEHLKSRQESALPEKHKHRPDTYKQFLERELKVVNAKIDQIKTFGVTDKK